ncbi:winged helix-turn-helix domain-containing protein [Paraferrimonas sedimenticola]|uniref:OmpR/PhoB-type domain-containing protein n=1 Tax=Paraferrimonas sedimenticola TaxID=375674 RepID=A0AA37RXQ6_9GAMM|nr:helix-turn-helix domain-containing protein [Paraferrimonas sedimenticola]GLP97050.1 hypothetical protein GCM10007895_23560 [Paraferrimonas sedimenticola]
MSDHPSLGHYRFDESKGLLYHDSKPMCKELPRAERLVLHWLFQSEGEAVNFQQLRCDESGETVISKSAVVKAVFSLRQFIGDKDHSHIQAVPGTGYRLVLTSAGDHLPAQSPDQNAELLSPIVFWGIAIVGLLGFWIALHYPIFFESPHATTTIQFESVARAQSGTDVSLIQVARTEQLLKTSDPYVQSLATQIGQCADISWSHIYLSLSFDGMLLAITFASDEGVPPRNFKINDFGLSPRFIDETWLREVKACD